MIILFHDYIYELESSIQYLTSQSQGGGYGQIESLPPSRRVQGSQNCTHLIYHQNDKFLQRER